MGDESFAVSPDFCVVACVAHAETGIAAFYGVGRTASGEVSGPNGLTAAHRTLPFGTKVLVTNMRNGRTVVSKVDADPKIVPGRKD
jgi:rare lipoprotein A